MSMVVDEIITNLQGRSFWSVAALCLLRVKAVLITIVEEWQSRPFGIACKNRYGCCEYAVPGKTASTPGTRYQVHISTVNKHKNILSCPLQHGKGCSPSTAETPPPRFFSPPPWLGASEITGKKTAVIPTSGGASFFTKHVMEPLILSYQHHMYYRQARRPLGIRSITLLLLQICSQTNSKYSPQLTWVQFWRC